MKIVIFGLTISSSWGNGHATVWRSLCRELIARGHDIVFFERDVPYYAAHRDLHELPGGALHLYGHWQDVCSAAGYEVREADVAITTSYCPDAVAASELIWSSPALALFYDLDAPVTIARRRAGQTVPYLHAEGLSAFDLVLSFTGGRVLDALRHELGARAVAPLYGSVDPAVHRRTAPDRAYAAALSYLGTYSTDRAAAVSQLFIEPAHRLSTQRFVLGGAQYPADFPWASNIYFVQHLPPHEHPAFFSSSRLTLNVTRDPMIAMGWCPSGRLFEAAACETPVITDRWDGIEDFFTPGAEIITAATADEVVAATQLYDAELGEIAARARERVLAEHTGFHRAIQLEQLLESARAEPVAA